MEADWSVEIGEDLARIVVPWTGDGVAFVDLCNASHSGWKLPEVQAFPALGSALAHLNDSLSLVFTSKCDVWRVADEDLDPLEMESTLADARFGIACYIDLVRRGSEAVASFCEQEEWLKRTTARLRGASATSARADLVLRQLICEGLTTLRREGFAVTLYVTGCGRDECAAQSSWERALAAASQVLATAA